MEEIIEKLRNLPAVIVAIKKKQQGEKFLPCSFVVDGQSYGGYIDVPEGFMPEAYKHTRVMFREYADDKFIFVPYED